MKFDNSLLFLEKINKMQPLDLTVYSLEYNVVPYESVSLNYWLGAFVRNNLLFAASGVLVREGVSLLDVISNNGEDSVKTDAPRGYAVQCSPIFSPIKLDESNSFNFRILLFGKFTDLYNQFHEAVVTMCHNGMGHPKTPLRIISFSCYPIPMEIPQEEISKSLMIEFVTPISLYSNRAKSVAKQGLLDKQNGIPTLYHLISAIMRRVGRLQEIYEDGLGFTEEDIERWCQDARRAQIEECSLKRIVLQGTPRKNVDNSIYYSGYIGRMVLSGVDRKYLPILHIGRFLNVGNDTAYGLGQYDFYTQETSKIESDKRKIRKK